VSAATEWPYLFGDKWTYLLATGGPITDSMIRSIDSECYAMRWTLRRQRIAWSEANMARARRLGGQGA
jgi:hypothetical protein